MKLQDLAVSRKDAFLIPIQQITAGANVREDFSDIEDLAISLFNMGQLHPIIVTLSADGKKAEIKDGERRFRAAQHVNKHFSDWSRGHAGGNKFDSLLCISAGKSIDDVTRILQQVEGNDQAKPLQPMERAKAFQLLIKKGMSQTDIAKRLGRTVQYVSDTLVLLKAPEEVQTAVRTGKMSATAATKAAKTKDAKKKAAAVEKAKKGSKVKVKDVASYTSLPIKTAREAVKRAKNFARVGKSNADKMKWEGIAHGIEIGVGLRPLEF